MSKKTEKVLIIGGAGFIGSHTADELERRKYKIRILDNLTPKVHTTSSRSAGLRSASWPVWVKPTWEKIKGDVRNAKTLEKALKGVDYVIHLAALMDLMPVYGEFFDTNVTSTARIYEIIVAKKLPIKKVIVASSQFVYGEGKWKCSSHGEMTPKVRTNAQMEQKKWESVCPNCKKAMTYIWAKEIHQDPPNQYAISKYTQELIALKLGRLNNIPSVAMRYSIVHGPRQSLKNAYSGALRVFTLQMLQGKAVSIYEDGGQLRDYVSVYDVARANADVLQSPKADYENFNVGSGKAYTVLELAEMVKKALGASFQFSVDSLQPTGEFRVGDIRHAVSDISKLKSLGWKPQLKEPEVVREYVEWVKKQKLDKDYLKIAQANLKKAGVVRGGC